MNTNAPFYARFIPFLKEERRTQKNKIQGLRLSPPLKTHLFNKLNFLVQKQTNKKKTSKISCLFSFRTLIYIFVMQMKEWKKKEKIFLMN